MYEESIRSLLHSRVHSHVVLFNPTQPQAWPAETLRLVDLTIDAIGEQSLQVADPAGMITWLNEAHLVSVDSQLLATALKRRGVRALVVVVPYGHSPLAEIGRIESQGNTGVGVLNHNFAAHVALKSHEYLLAGLGIPENPVRVFGDYDWSYDPIVADTGALRRIESWEQFSVEVQVLLLPAHPGELVSLALPMSLMLTGAVCLCSRQSAYYELPGPGVHKLEAGPQAWQETMLSLATRPQLLLNMMIGNRRMAELAVSESIQRLRKAILRPEGVKK